MLLVARLSESLAKILSPTSYLLFRNHKLCLDPTSQHHQPPANNSPTHTPITMASASEQYLTRDPALFLWILLPITVVMILTGVLRHYASVLLQTPPKPASTPEESRERLSLTRGNLLRSNCPALSKSSFEQRKEFLIDNYKKGTFLKAKAEAGKDAPPPNPMDPAAMEGMMGMMKGNMAMMIPQTLIMSWINAFFAGFVILRLPFPLTIRFKSMLQSGVMTRDLDVRWVSSLSWYFLCLFGLQGVFVFILGNDNAASQMAQQMGAMQPAAGAAGPVMPGQDVGKMFVAEAENLEVAEWWGVLDGVEDRLLAKNAL